MRQRLATSPCMTTLTLFTAAWCTPCKALKPTLAKLAEDYRGRIAFTEVDCDREQDVAQRFDVRSVPTIVLERDGREVGRTVGARPQRFLAGMLDRALAGDVQIASP
jgi:putative thioredoxin